MKKLVDMAIIYSFCEKCNTPVEIHVGQAISVRELVWNLSYTCSHCGWQIEEDGTGVPPEELRKAILEAEGEWSLAILETGNSAMLAIKILRETMELSLSEALRLKKMIPGTVVTGTRAEIERLRKILVAKELKVESRPC
ncbi:hypothetical protein [Phormidium nigroviride]